MGENLYVHLSGVYKDKARYCVMFLSEHYTQKLWAYHELENAQARAFFKENEEYILPVRLDDTEIPAILPTVGYLDLRKLSIDKVYQALVVKLSGESSQVTSVSRTPSIVEDDPGEFVLLRSEDRKLCFIPLQDVNRDSEEISLQLLPESSEDIAFLSTLQNKLGGTFANRITLSCAYREYAAWVSPRKNC